MLVYLFFVFTCGWCVCWLLFLNYQQHVRDAHLTLVELDEESGAPVTPPRLELLASKKRKRRGRRKLLVRHTGQLDLAEPEAGPEVEVEAEEEEESEQECAECGRPSQPGELVLDWPATNRCEESCEEAELGARAWPLVEIHENELANASANYSDNDDHNELGQALDRSRLLSLRPSQLRNRAAIRLVSRELREGGPVSAWVQQDCRWMEPAVASSQPAIRSKLDYQASQLETHAN